MADNNVVSSIPAFIGGVSQQSPALRLKTQCDALDNGHATVADGLMKRPNTDLVKVLGAISGATGYKVHKIYRDATEKYIAIFTSDATNPVRVYDLTGTAMTVRYGYYDSSNVWQTDSTKKQYLSSGGITNAKKQIKAISIADYTIIVNTMKTTAAESATTSAKTDAAYVYIKGCHKGSYNITYKWTVGGTPNSASTTVTPAYADGVLNYDCDSLMDYFINNNPNATYITISGVNNVLKVAPTGSADANSVHVAVSDPYGGQDLIPVNWCEVDGADKLPPQMPENVTIKVGGDADIQQDDYYMNYTYNTKIWNESVGFGLTYELDVDTMPYRLIRSATNQFDFCPIDWEDRTVGDDNTNPMPSFIGETIDNAIFAKNRIWFLSNENAIASKAGDFFNFFASTVMDVIDDDPIDVSASGEQVTKFRSGKGFDGGLFLISDEEQFALTSGEQLMTPKSAAIDATCAYTADPYSDPIKLGSDIYFVSPKGAYLSVREYTVMPDTMMKDAYDVTAHVPKYIPVGDVVLSGCNNLDMLFLHTSGDTDAIFVHKFLWDGDRKVQQAWYRWIFADDVYGMVTFGTVLYILFYDATNGFRLEKINLENIPYTGQSFRYHLDSLMKVENGNYSNPSTTFTLDRNCGTGTGYSVINASTNAELTSGWSISGTTLTITGDVSANTYFVGKDYTLSYTFSEWYVRTGQGDAVISGDTKIRNLILSFQDTGYFQITVTPFNRDGTTETLTKDMSGVRVDESTIGSVTLLSGEESFLIMADSRRTDIKLVSDSYLPVSVQLGAWEGTYVQRSRILD